MTEVAAITGTQKTIPRHGLALHPWRWFFLIALVPTVVVALAGGLIATNQINTDGFALLAALLVAWSCGKGEARLSGASRRRIVVFAAALAALLAINWWGGDSSNVFVLPLFTVIVTATALSGAYAGTPALRDLARPLFMARAAWPAWLVAVLAWPLLGAVGIAATRLGAQSEAIRFGSDAMGPWFVAGSVAAAIPATLAWYGFAARRLLESRSPLLTAVLVALVPWLAIVLPASIWSDPLSQLVLGLSHPFDSYVVRSCLGALAVGVVGVWIYQRSRPSLLPVLAFLSETMIVSWAVFVWAGPRFGLDDRLSWLMVVLHWALALVLIAQARMWRTAGGAGA